MNLKPYLLRLLHWLMETDREDRLETLRGIADYYERKAQEARREINLVMSEPALEKMREVGF